LVHTIPLHTSETSCAIGIILLAVGILGFANELLGKSVPFATSRAVAVWTVREAESNLASLLLVQSVRIIALVAPLVVEAEAAFDHTSSRFVSKGSVAGNAAIIVIILAPRCFLLAFL